MSNTVFVSNLSLSINSSMLEDMFSLVGNVRKAVVHIDAVSGLSQGFGLVEMSTAEEAHDCVIHFNGQRKEGTTLIVRAKDSLVAKPIVPKASRTGLMKTARNAGLKAKHTTR